MSLLKNILNITSLLIHDPSHPKAIEHCFLFLTSESFRNKSYNEQIKSINHIRKKMSNDVDTILQISTTDINNPKYSYKSILKTYPNASNLPKLLDDPDSPLGKEFIFILEELVKTFRIIIVERGTFVLYKSAEFKESDKFIIIKKVGSKEYFPVFSQPNKFIFTLQDDVIHLIKMFHIQRIDPNLPISNIDSSDTSNISQQPNNEQVYMIDKDDIFFSEEEELFVKYNNPNNTILFTKEEEVLHLQNLLSSSPNKTEKANGQNVVQLFHDYSLVNHHSLFDLKTRHVATTERHLDDWEEFIDNHDVFKKSFPHTLFVSSPFYQNNQNSLDQRNVVNNRTIIRNSFTNTFVYYNEDIVIDADDLSTINSKLLKRIIEHHKLTVSGSTKETAQSLISFNLLSKYIINKTESITTKDLRKLATDSFIHNLPKAGSRSSLLKFLSNEHASIFKHMFTMESLLEIRDTHKISNVANDFDQLYEDLSSVNIIRLASEWINSKDNNTKNKNNKVVFTKNVSSAEINPEDANDHVTQIMASINTPLYPPESIRYLQLFQPTTYDVPISVNGFYYQGNTVSSEFEVFDVANYLNILQNIHSFLPLKCTIVFHADHPNVYEGEILPIDNDITDLLQIKYNNTTIFYNLSNIHDNSFFVYPEFYDGYLYQKRDLNKNIYFYIDNYPYIDMLRFVSLSVKEYVHLFNMIIDSFDSLRNIMTQFNVDLFTINEEEYNLFKTFVIKPIVPSPNNIALVENNDTPQTRMSAFKFLRFDLSNTSDLSKMFLLHRQNYFQIILDSLIDKYKSHSFETLDTKPISNSELSSSSTSGGIRNTNTKSFFNSFRELQEYKTKLQGDLENNTMIELLSRHQETENYLETHKKVIQKYTGLIADIQLFHSTKHEKTFIKEVKYIKKRKNKDGSEVVSDTHIVFVNSNPDVFHAPIVVENDTHNDEEKSKLLSDLDNLILITGIAITPKEKEYILYHSENLAKILVVSQKQKNERSISNPNDLNIFYHFVRHVGFSAYITIFAQVRYNVTTVFAKCGKFFSLHGFPFDGQKERTFTKYIACILYILLKEKNKFIQSQAFIDTYIQAAIKIIFQQNTNIKSIFDRLVQKNKNKPTHDTSESGFDTFKPFFISKTVETLVENNNKTNIHQVDNDKVEKPSNNLEFLPIEALLQCLHINTSRKKTFNVIDVFENIKLINKREENVTTDSEMDDATLDSLLTSKIDNFDESFFRVLGFPPIRTSTFLKIFVENHGDYQNASKYSHLIKINQVYINILKTYEHMSIYSNVFFKTLDSVVNDSSNPSFIILRLYETLENVLKDIAETDNIFTFLYVSSDDRMKTNFKIIIKEFRNYISAIETKYQDQLIDFEHLKLRAEILREEDKQKKLSKFDHINDDLVDVIRNLQNVGIDMDAAIDQMQQANDDQEEGDTNRMDNRNSDDNDNDE